VTERHGFLSAWRSVRFVVVLAAGMLGWSAVAGRALAQDQVPPGPLSKAHAALATPAGGCETCHAAPGKIDAARCLTCHQPVAARIAAKRGVHRDVTGDCEACHQEHQGADADLRPLDAQSFDHPAETGFPLGGAHAKAACSSCHKTRSYLGNKPDCQSCHAEPHRGTLGRDCAACHSPASAFRSASRAFHKIGLFPLEGKHLSVACSSCHWNGVTKGTPTRCYDCHWVRRQDDRYRTQLGNQCENCHTTTSWAMVRWNHAAATGTRLSPQHGILGCGSCHKDQVLRANSVSCVSCHQQDYQRTMSPNHVAAGFPPTCDMCHKPSDPSFRGVPFNHGQVYQLAGVHATEPCSACHGNNVYKGTPRDCYPCHQGDYQRATSPNHVAAGFPTTCDSCHRNSAPSFSGAGFSHNPFYALVGVHATQACSACHKNDVYKGTPRDCYPCHQTDYQRAQNPNHVAAGFPTTCDACHRQSDLSFRGASFNHGTVFSLVGVHATQPCAACHKNGVYRGTPRNCFGCHATGYQQSQNPNHVGAGFATSCDQCHLPTDATWHQGRFTHTAFPITSGRHAGNQCATCHVDPGNYRVFSCTVCHDRAQTDRIHQGRPGYRYDSNACYSCHPQGRG
jgi:hypothetical protein